MNDTLTNVWTCPEPGCGTGMAGPVTSADIIEHHMQEHAAERAVPAAEIIAAEYGLDADLVRTVTTPGVESVARQITRTGQHPITQGAPRHPGRHAAPWTPARAYEDAHQALECYQPTGRRRATEYIGTAYPLQPHEAEAAVWTKGVLQ